MSISYNGNPNPTRVLVNSADADHVKLMIPAASVLVPWPIWNRLDMNAPSSMSLITIIGATAEIWLRNLTLLSVSRLLPDATGYYEVATYECSEFSFEYDWDQYAHAGSAYRNGRMFLQQNPTGSGGAARITGVPSSLDYDYLMIDNGKVVNIDFKADIVRGGQNPSQASGYATIRADLIITPYYYTSDGSLMLVWEPQGNWQSQTTWSYSGDGVSAYTAYEGEYGQKLTPFQVKFYKRHPNL